MSGFSGSSPANLDLSVTTGLLVAVAVAAAFHTCAALILVALPSAFHPDWLTAFRIVAALDADSIDLAVAQIYRQRSSIFVCFFVLTGGAYWLGCGFDARSGEKRQADWYRLSPSLTG